jgi:hypothetical protein
VTGSFFMEDVSDLGESLFDAVVLFDVWFALKVDVRFELFLLLAGGGYSYETLPKKRSVNKS